MYADQYFRGETSTSAEVHDGSLEIGTGVNATPLSNTRGFSRRQEADRMLDSFMPDSDLGIIGTEADNEPEPGINATPILSKRGSLKRQELDTAPNSILPDLRRAGIGTEGDKESELQSELSEPQSNQIEALLTPKKEVERDSRCPEKSQSASSEIS